MGAALYGPRPQFFWRSCFRQAFYRFSGIPAAVTLRQSFTLMLDPGHTLASQHHHKYCNGLLKGGLTL
jgi:hypothetical protein